MTDTFTPIPFDGFVSAKRPDPYGARGTQIGETVAGLDGKHYSVDWTFSGPCLICAEDGTQQNITSARFVADQTAVGLQGIGFFVPAFGALGVPNSPYFYVWAQDGAFLFGQETHIVFLRYVINVDGTFSTAGGSQFKFDGAGGNRLFCLNTSGGNGTVFGAVNVGNFLYISYTSAINPGGTGSGSPCMAAIPFTSTYNPAYLDWVAHNINLQPNFGDSFWNTDNRSGFTGVWSNIMLSCLVDNGDQTGTAIQYVGNADIALSPNPNVNTLTQAAFLAFDFFFTPAAFPLIGGTWTISSLYQENVVGITFPFADANKNRAGAAGNAADDYYSPSPCKIHGNTYLLVPRAYSNQSEWSPADVGVKYLVFTYVKGTMTFANGTYQDSPYNPVTDFGFAGNPLVATISTFQAFVAQNTDEIWSLTQYAGDGQFVYSRLFSVSSPPPPVTAKSYVRIWGDI